MKLFKSLLLVALLVAGPLVSFSQTQPHKRTTSKTERLDFGAGGTLAVTGAPAGSISIEGWQNPQIEITAEIVVEGNSEADVALLSQLTTFVLEESLGRTGIVSVGVNDKAYVKKLGKKLPKHLVGMPFRIDYVIKVPRYCDLQIDGGKGDLSISGVEGAFRLNYLETDAKIELLGGITYAVFGKGSVELAIPRAGWRGRSADVSLSSGDMNIRLPSGINAELDATILRTGKIENLYSGLTPRTRKGEFTEKSIIAKSGVGGVPLKFTVGDGTLKLGPSGG